MDFAKRISKYVSENLLYVDEGFEYDYDTSFIGEGLIDSMGVMELLSYVQSEFDIRVDQQEVTPDNFDSINKLAAFVERKQRVLAPAGD
jgi:acyl carrier protein